MPNGKRCLPIRINQRSDPERISVRITAGFAPWYRGAPCMFLIMMHLLTLHSLLDKSEAEIKAIKAANKASEKVVKVASSIPSVPSFDSVKNDWKFWVGILAVVSIAFSLISASGQSAQMASGGDSFYI